MGTGPQGKARPSYHRHALRRHVPNMSFLGPNGRGVYDTSPRLDSPNIPPQKSVVSLVPYRAVASHCLYCVSGLSLHRSTRRRGQCNVRHIPGRLEVGARNLDLRQLDRHRGTREDREVPALSIQTHHSEIIDDRSNLMAIEAILNMLHMYEPLIKGGGCLAKQTRITSLLMS